MKTKLLFLSSILFSLSISSQIDFETRVIVENHPDVMGPYTANSADLDGDGDKDILATSTNGNKIVWFENLDGLGNFSEPKQIATGLDYPIYLDTSDIDNDGDMDIVATGDFKFIWLENLDGLGTFSTQKSISNNTNSSEAFEINDIDSDGDMDLIYSDSWLNKVVWFENTDGLGTFGSEKLITNLADGTNTVFTKDLDGDDDIDVITTSYPNEIAWYENIDGQGNFGPARNIFTTPEYIYRVCSDDLDGDGDNDIIALIYHEGKIIWFENDGAGNFGNEQILLTDFTLTTSVYTDDYNNDGEIDILATSFNQNKIILLDNRGPLSIEENTTNLFSIYPNPTNGFLNINAKLPISEITIYNNLGQLLFTSEEKNQIDISTLSEGIYFLKITDENGQTKTKKVLKK